MATQRLVERRDSQRQHNDKQAQGMDTPAAASSSAAIDTSTVGSAAALRLRRITKLFAAFADRAAVTCTQFACDAFIARNPHAQQLDTNERSRCTHKISPAGKRK
jgi:hypothetical protein